MPAAARPAIKADATPIRVSTAIWVDDELVCVEIVDSPAPHVNAGVCRCLACHDASYADLAAKFYPEN